MNNEDINEKGNKEINEKKKGNDWKNMDGMKRMKIKYIVVAILGITCILIGIFFPEQNSYWTGMGTLFLILSGLRMIQFHRYSTNEEYAEKINVMNSDERNRFLAEKASRWTFYYYNLAAAILVIILEAMGKADLAQIIAYTICAQVGIYWICYLRIKRKY